MTWPMLCVLLAVLSVMISDILYALKDKRAARRYIALATFYAAIGLAMIKGWI